MKGLISGMAIGFVAAASMLSGRTVLDVAHPETIREVAELTADCMDRNPRSVAKQFCLSEWERVLKAEASQ